MAPTIQILLVFVALVFIHPTISTTIDPPSTSPTPAPESGADIPNVPAPSPLSNLTSPPAPPPSDLSPAPSPVNADSPPSSSPAPAPNTEVASDISHESESSSEKESSGMNGAKKAGIAIGVIAAVSFVGAGAFVYKKRQQNIQRSQFGFDARREIL